MNWFMIKADRYWFPSPESKYKAGLDELKEYREQPAKRRGPFYTRTDNLIPLLLAYEDLLGSCDDNLVKQHEKDGSHVSLFKADDYFFYARGVASALHTILEAVHVDFHTVIESRRGGEVLHHAIVSLQEAMEIDPLLVTEQLTERHPGQPPGQHGGSHQPRPLLRRCADQNAVHLILPETEKQRFFSGTLREGRRTSDAALPGGRSIGTGLHPGALLLRPAAPCMVQAL
jgi:hypothetical protein